MSSFTPKNNTAPAILSVSEVTTKIKALLEKNLPFIWINGEISNLNKSSAEHLYFVLKDSNAQINAVMFKTQRRGLMFAPENGMHINCLGRLNVYEQRGNYQVIVEYAEKSGLGAMHMEFEQLKARLEHEGLFAPENKRPLPPYPRKIALITSPDGAVIHDMQVVARRKMPVIMEILPVKVQGREAVAEIVNALNFLREMPDVDVAVLARGGGSFEDMLPFNSEEVARAIAAAPVPVVSAVGHETDFTISDFVADLRAPTPSAAIDMLLPDHESLDLHLQALSKRLYGLMRNRILLQKALLERLEMRMGLAATRFSAKRQAVSYYEYKLKQNIIRQLQNNIQALAELKLRLNRQSPAYKLNANLFVVNMLEQKLKVIVENKYITYLNKTKNLNEKLLLLGPAATLQRGYAIVTNAASGLAISDAGTVKPQQQLKIIIKNGHLWCTVEKVTYG